MPAPFSARTSVNLHRTLLALVLLAAGMRTATGEAPNVKTPAGQDEPQLGSLTRSNLAEADSEFRRFLAAARELETAKKGFAAGTMSLDELLTAERRLTAAQLRHAAVTVEVRGSGTSGNYMARRAEVAALQRAMRDVTRVRREVAADEATALERELNRYSAALEEAQRNLAKAEHAWKMEFRAQQFGRLRYSR